MILKIEEDASGSGLWFAESPDVRGLLVAEPTFEACLAAIPKALSDLKRASELPGTALPTGPGS